jgi:hypothetical protein
LYIIHLFHCLDVSSEVIKKNSGDYGFKELLPVFSHQMKDLEELYKFHLKALPKEFLYTQEVSKEVGKSLFASQDLSKGCFLFYFGEVVNKMSKTKISMTLFGFGEGLFVDCSRYRSKAYYIHHGCEPNCTFEEV